MERGKLTKEERAALVKGIAKLSDVQSVVIILRYLEGKSLEFVSEELKLSPEEIAAEHHAALLNLRRLITDRL